MQSSASSSSDSITKAPWRRLSGLLVSINLQRYTASLRQPRFEASYAQFIFVTVSSRILSYLVLECSRWEKVSSFLLYAGRVTQPFERQSAVVIPAQLSHARREAANVIVRSQVRGAVAHCRLQCSAELFRHAVQLIRLPRRLDHDSLIQSTGRSFFYEPASQADQQSTSGDSSASVTTVEVDEKPAGVSPRVSDPVLQSLLDGTFAKQRAAESEDSGEEEEPKAVQKPKRNRPKKLVPQEKAVATAWGWDGKTGRDIEALEKWLRGRGLPAQKVELQLVKEGGRGLVALQNIGKGEGILEIPADLLITEETVRMVIGAQTASAG